MGHEARVELWTKYECKKLARKLQEVYHMVELGVNIKICCL
jgi:hypothetical protein